MEKNETMGRYRNFVQDLKLNHEIRRWRKIEKKKIYRKSEQKIVSGKCLSKKETDAISAFYGDVLKKSNYFWHLKYKTVSGNFCENFFPELFYNADLKHRLNDAIYTSVYSNKIILSKIIRGSSVNVSTPNNILVCNEGLLTDGNDSVISKDQAKQLLMERKKFFCKKSVGTYGGEDCKLVSNPTVKDVDYILSEYGRNFLIQELVENQDDIKTINPDTLNTFRIITYFASGQFHTSPIVLRIGRKNQFVDNAHAGGVFVGVGDDGTIITDAKSALGETFVKHPDTDITFKGYRIANVQKLRNKAIELAQLFPQTKLIDWDLALDKNGDVVCIEANIESGSIWLVQMSHGAPVFGPYTQEMLKFVGIKNFFKIIKTNLKK